MSKFIKTLRRAVLASIITSSLVPAAFAGSRSDSLHQKANQVKSSVSNHVQNVRKSLPSTSQIKNALPSKSSIQNKLQSFKNDVKKNIPFSTTGSNLKNGVLGGAALERLQKEKAMFQKGGKTDKVVPFTGGNTGITGRGTSNSSLANKTPVKLNNSTIPANRKIDTSKLQTLSFGDVLSAPADLGGSVLKAGSKALPGDAGKALDTASKVLDVNAKINKTLGDEVGKAIDPPTPPKPEKKGFTSQGQGNATTTKPPKPIKSSGKAKPAKDPAFFNPDGSLKSSLPVISGSSSGTGGGFIQMFPMQADGTFKTPAGNAPVTNTPPVAGGRPSRGDSFASHATSNQSQQGFGGKGFRGNVLSNIPQGGSFGGAQVQTQDFVEAAPAPQVIEAAPVQPVAQAQAIETETSTADLVLVDVKLVEPATQLAGPAYALRFSNQGLAPTSKFITAAITSNDGKMTPDAPKAMVEVPGMAAGATKEIVLRLPRGESKYLFLALDLNGNVTESDKENNVAVIERAE